MKVLPAVPSKGFAEVSIPEDIGELMLLMAEQLPNQARPVSSDTAAFLFYWHDSPPSEFVIFDNAGGFPFTISSVDVGNLLKFLGRTPHAVHAWRFKGEERVIQFPLTSRNHMQWYPVDERFWVR